MKTRILFALVGMMSLISFVPNAYSCSCSSYPDFLQTMMESRTAFQGTVTKIIESEYNEKIYFDITFPQKGIVNVGEHVIEQSKRSSCAVNYRIGETYQVFTYYADGILGTTNMCSTKQITGFSEYWHETDDDQAQYYREDHNILTQYSLATMIIPIAIAIIIPSVVVWRKRK